MRGLVIADEQRFAELCQQITGTRRGVGKVTTTTIAPKPGSLIQSQRLGSELAYGELRFVVAEFDRATESFEVFADRAEDREAIWRLILPWMPLAETRFSEADGSPTDQARWREIIAGVQQSAVGTETIPDVGTLIQNASRLLRALAADTRGGPSVREIADRVRESITSGSYTPGNPISLGRIAAETGCPLAVIYRVRLADRDLEAEGLISCTPADRIRIAGRSEAVDRPAQITAWLRQLIQAGVYPPGSELPTRTELGRALVMGRRPRDEEADRAAIRTAADRLLAGTPLRSRTGKLTASELITESDLRRDVVYRHTDLI